VDDKLRALEARLDALDRQLMDPAVVSNAGKLRDAMREHSQVTEIVDAWRAVKSLEGQIAEARHMTQDDDLDVREMARAELSELEPRAETARAQLRLKMLPKDPYEGRPILLEIRAGTGGDEAGLFVADLFRMYGRYGDKRGLKFDVMSSSPITAGGGLGYKEIIASVTGRDAYNLLRFEGGTHRVQRIPATETQGRIHTSAATIAVLPEPDEIEVKIDAKDLRIDTMRAGGPGGQSVNTTDSAVRIVHIPTGLIVQCQDEKSQIKNREKALRVLKTRLFEIEQAARLAEETAARRAQVGSGDRSERIRTYNFPQNRVTDHRIGLTLHRLDSVIEGDLDELVDALTADLQAKLLAESA